MLQFYVNFEIETLKSTTRQVQRPGLQNVKNKQCEFKYLKKKPRYLNWLPYFAVCSVCMSWSECQPKEQSLTDFSASSRRPEDVKMALFTERRRCWDGLCFLSGELFCRVKNLAPDLPRHRTKVPWGKKKKKKKATFLSTEKSETRP